ncbi:MAG: DNA repair protein RadC [Clostridiales Family XIII bacterium]|nr:DNA repair protein RadC [Clostridiales Family XIII bacterium]
MIKKLPEDERPREKLIRQGRRSLSNTELLSLLIGSGTHEASATELAGRVLAQTDTGLAGLRDSSPEELRAIRGIGDAIACRLIAAAEIGTRIGAGKPGRGVKVDSAAVAAGICEGEFAGEKQECFAVIMLNVKGLMIGLERISKGGINSSIAEPRDVFRGAVKRGAAAIVALHNHPSGDPEPSESDVLITKRLAAAGEVLGVKMLDHVIIGNDAYVSLKDRGFM